MTRHPLAVALLAVGVVTAHAADPADLIVHVRDVSHPDSDAQAADVEQVLAGIGVTDRDGTGRAVPMMEAWNKLDALDAEAAAIAMAEAARRDDVVLISALTGEGIDALARALSERLTAGARVRAVRVDAGDGASIAWLHAHGEVIAQAEEGGAITLEVRISEDDWDRFRARD